MKVLIVLFALAAVIVADWSVKSPEDVINIRKDCFTKVSLPTDLQEKIKKFEYPDSEVVHQYLECSMKGLGVFEEKTGYNVDHIIDQFAHGKSEVRPLIEKCISEKGATDVWNVWICMVEGGFLTQQIKEQIQH